MRDFHLPGRSAVYAETAMAATSHPLATSVAVDVLRRGGNAVDAAITAAVLLGLLEPAMTGIGGDCFAMLKPAGEERLVGLNASGRAPAGLTAAMLREQGCEVVPPRSAHAVTVPGAVAGFETLIRDWGRWSLADALAPAIHYAEAGAPVAPRVAHDWAGATEKFQGAARRFFLKDGAPYRAGDRFAAPGQAEVLRRIAAEGAAGFYQGEVAQDMVDSLRALGGTHALEDFATVAPEYVEPVRGGYRDVEIAELPPNGHGVTALLLAKLLERFDLSALPPFGAARAHLEAEATRLAYDARNRFIGDPAAASGLDPMLDAMLSADKAARLSALIDPDRAIPDAALAAEPIHLGAPHTDTITLSVVDKDRMAVSLIYSVFQDFGSGLASERFGINFHNRGAGFTLREGAPNELAPGKRPLHTIIPAFLIRDGRPVMPFGVMGGQYQATGHMRFVSNIVDYGMDPQQAIDGPRCFVEDGALMLENGYAEAEAEALRALGHDVRRRPGALGGAQAVMIDWDRGVLIGGSDPRKDGAAMGW
jgi:gamma-glutamyltranspeptidase/glutathione hydrolase